MSILKLLAAIQEYNALILIAGLLLVLVGLVLQLQTLRSSGPRQTPPQDSSDKPEPDSTNLTPERLQKAHDIFNHTR